ncbi:MAG: hypothetical protein GXX91_11790 [Verrucomicrobiaceae bacterium]|nr:hypothetical protein [Verrucomicrobiaceae bacterium]
MMKPFPIFLVALFGLILSPGEAGEVRTLTNAEGKKIEAELLSQKDGKVRIMSNRRVFEVPIASLSKEDQEFLATWKPDGIGDEEEEPENYYSELIFEDDFSEDEFDERWSHYKSESIVDDGVLVGKTIDINDHAGVDAIRFEGRRDLEVSVKFNFAGESAERFNIWLDDKDYKGSHAGHISSIVISPTGGSISDAKTGNFENAIYEKRKGGGTLNEETQEMLKKKTAHFRLDIDREEWHTLLIRTKGDLVTVSINGYEIGKLKSEGLAHPTKSLVSLTTNVNDVHYDDFVVRAAKGGAPVE